MKFGDVLTTDEVPSSGTTILNGTGPPADALGAVGNYYLDTVAKILYGPKGPSGVYGPDQIPNTGTPANTTVATYGVTYGIEVIVLVAGRITALRYYRVVNAAAITVPLGIYQSGNTTALATATINNAAGAPAGWVSVNLATPVITPANTTYRAGYVPYNNNYGYTSSFNATSAVPSLITLNNNCTGTGEPGYPGNNSTTANFAGIVFQALVPPWPVALKSAP